MLVYHQKEIIKSACLIITLTAGAFILHNHTTSINGMAKPVPHKILYHITVEGLFTISNTTEEKELFQTPIWGTAIGSTWNISITLYSNSSSSLNFTFFSSMLEWWEGKGSFLIDPSNSHSEDYIQHGMSDEPPSFNFNYDLLDPTKYASGEYSINQTFSGFDADFHTGSIYVSNITAWLEQRTLTSSATIFSTTSSFLNFSMVQSVFIRLFLPFLFLGIGLLYIWKKQFQKKK